MELELEGQSSKQNGVDGNLIMTTMTSFPVPQLELSNANVQAQVSSVDPINEQGDAAPNPNPDTTGQVTVSSLESATISSTLRPTAPCHTETVVEVCVKMVVCRKYITNTVDSNTGHVLRSSTRTEEDQPTIVDVHRYTIPHSDSGTLPSLPLPPPTHTPIVKRRPGRPRKTQPPSVPPSAKAENQQQKVDTDSLAERTTKETTTLSETNLHTSAVKSGDYNDKHPGDKPAASSQTSVNEDNKKKVFAVKRKRGRPSRVIKKPRKYIDDFEEDFKPDSAEEAEEDEDGEVEQEEKHTSTIKEENKGDEKLSGGDGDRGDEDEKREDEDGKRGEVEREGGEVEREGGEVDGGEGGKSEEETNMECPKCGKKFSNSSNCQRHINKDLCSRPRQLQCAFCDQLFATKELLETHTETHRDKDSENNYRCGDCNRIYATRNGYLKHKRQGTCYKRDVFHEDGRQGEFECSVCHVRFTTDKLLELHKEKVHENPNNEYKCPDCSRVFYSKLGFNKHVAKRSCTQPHECKVCGKKYSNKAKESFKSHMRYHLAETSGVQFQCEDCGRVYMTDLALKKHKLTSHSGLRPYKCSTCFKTFPMRYMMRDHERSHTGEKPFLCNLCGTSFSNRGHLYRHMRSHNLGTLHKRGRPRKYPLMAKPIVLKFQETGDEDQSTFEDLGAREREREREGAGTELVQIKSDPMQSDSVEEMSSLGGEPTYITVHTIDGTQLGEGAGTASVVGEGSLQHVVMEAPDGMTDNMVLQVIRDLTGATTVYQHITEQSSTSSPIPGQPSQIIMSAAAPQQMTQTLVVEPQSGAHGVVSEQSSSGEHIIISTPVKDAPVSL